LAAEPAGEAVRAWGRLGYPRRALRLHAAAGEITASHGGEVPPGFAALLALPGIGTYTAAAVAAFAFGGRETVVDTNIRRVHARLFLGKALPAPALAGSEMKLAAELLPADAGLSVLWNAGVMELGATVCTARSPRCPACPVADACAWLAAGSPAPDYVPKGQAWAGTDRQDRGAVMSVLRAAEAPVDIALFGAGATGLGGVTGLDGATGLGGVTGLDGAHSLAVGAELGRLYVLAVLPEQLDRAIAGILADGLAETGPAGLSLPG
jgi:A/G-specific adenine glycosylase